jgi:Carboxypeptidase regulatory-like domain
MTANRHYALRFVSILSTIIMLALPLAAQVDQVAISGTVTDSSGAAVQGAKIELLSTATGLHRETTTNTTGIYHLPALQIGKYKITVSKEGFKSVEFPNVELSVGQPRTIDVRLEVGTISTMVQVTATVEPLNRSSAEVGGLIETEQIKQIPISGRNWASLMLLTPGAINYGDGAQRAIRFSGHSLDDSNFTFDGVDPAAYRNRRRKPIPGSISLSTPSRSSASAPASIPPRAARRAARRSTSCRRPAQTSITAVRFTPFATTRSTRALRSTIRQPDFLRSRCISLAEASAAP